MGLVSTVCRLLVRALPRTHQTPALDGLPEVIASLVAERRLERGWTSSAVLAASEVASLVVLIVRLQFDRLGREVTRLLTAVRRGTVPDLRVLLLVSLRDGGSSLAFVSIVSLAAGAGAAVASLNVSIRAEATSVETADRLSWVWAQRAWETGAPALVSDAHLRHLRQDANGFDGFAAVWMVSGRVTGGTSPVHVDVVRASANAFDLMDVRPAMGRLFQDGDDLPGAPWVAVLTHDFWQSHFGAAPDVIGRRIVVGVPEMEIVGVLPEGFRLPIPSVLGPYGEPSVWLPTRHAEEGQAFPHDVQAILALRRAEVMPRESRAELERLGAAADSLAYEGRGFRYVAKSIPTGSTPGLTRARGLSASALVFMLLVAFGTVGLVAGSGTARLMRTVETLRLLGGQSGRVGLLLVLDALLKGLVGAAIGVSAAAIGLRILSSAPALPAFMPVDSVRPGMLVFAASSIALGLALTYGAVRVTAFAGSGGRGVTAGRASRWMGRLLIGTQVGLTLVLLLGATAMHRALDRALAGAGGFEPDGLVAFSVYPMPNEYPDAPSRERFLSEVERRLGNHRGISSVASVSALPFSGGSTQLPAGRDRPASPLDPATFAVTEWVGFDGTLVHGSEGSPGASRVVDLNLARPGFFKAIGASVTRGREFDVADSRNSTPVVVIDQRLARALWQPGESAVGDSMWIVGAWRRVVGVVGHFPLHGPSRDVGLQAWVPQSQVLGGRISIVARTDLDLTDFGVVARAAAEAVDPGLPISDIVSVPATLLEHTEEERFVSAVISVLSALAFALAVLALAAVLGGSVARRRGEIAVRMALGGTPRQIGRLVVGDVGAAVFGGAAAGGMMLWAASLLFDPLASVGGFVPEVLPYATVMMLCAPLACLSIVYPLRRAVRTNPRETLVAPRG